MTKLTPFIKLALALGLIVVLLLLVGPAACNRMRSLEAQQRMGAEQGKAAGNSAKDAIETQGQANQRERASEELTRSNEEEIRNAQGSEVAVHPDAHAAGLSAICRREANRNSERCKLHNANPR